MSQHPQVEAKIVEELKSLDLLATPEQPQPRAIQWDDVPKLTYLTAVIKVGDFIVILPTVQYGNVNYRDGADACPHGAWNHQSSWLVKGS